MEERLQKLMSRAGLGSRRTCEELILAGRVSVNGRVAEIGQKADPATDKIVVDGRQMASPESLIYIALHKPRNVLSAAEAEAGDNRQTVRDLISLPGHLYPVGRLDFDSEGLVLMTNDGDLTNQLTHPRFGHIKVYRVLVARRPEEDQLATWRRGVVLEDGYKTAPCDVSFQSAAGKGAWIRVMMHEGRKRQIREIGSLLGLPVVRIIRIAIGTLRLDDLKPGEWRHLTAQEVAHLKNESPRPRSGQPGKNRRTERPHSRPPFKERATNSERSDRSERSERPARPQGKPARPGESSDRPANRSERSPKRPAPRTPASDRPTRPERPQSRPGTSANRPARPTRSNERPPAKPGRRPPPKNKM